MTNNIKPETSRGSIERDGEMLDRRAVRTTVYNERNTVYVTEIIDNGTPDSYEVNHNHARAAGVAWGPEIEAHLDAVNNKLQELEQEKRDLSNAWPEVPIEETPTAAD